MKFNVTLDKEQIEQIANLSADKVLETVEYARNKEQYYKNKVKELKSEIQKRDSMLIRREMCISRLMERIRRLKKNNTH